MKQYIENPFWQSAENCFAVVEKYVAAAARYAIRLTCEEGCGASCSVPCSPACSSWINEKGERCDDLICEAEECGKSIEEVLNEHIDYMNEAFGEGNPFVNEPYMLEVPETVADSHSYPDEL